MALGPFELGIVGLIVVILPFIALVDIFRSSRLASEKAIFTLLIFLVPVIGLVAYLLLRGED